MYTRIVSPVNGRVGLRQVDQGNYVTPGDANGIVVINQVQPITRDLSDSRGQCPGAHAASARGRPP